MMMAALITQWLMFIFILPLIVRSITDVICWHTMNLFAVL